jgi:hypothetical protein
LSKALPADFRFGGHQTFALRIAWLPKAAAAIEVGVDPLSNPIDGVIHLGLGKNMVEALRCWIEAFGVASKIEGKWQLTPLGAAVFGSNGLDRYLEDDQTLWLLHWNISTLRKAPFFAWELLVNRWNEASFVSSAVVSAFLAEANRAERTLSAVTAKQHFDVWLHTYFPTRSAKNEDSLDSPLSALRLVYHHGTREVEGGRAEPIFAFDLGSKTNIKASLFEYCLHQWWDTEFEHEETISLSEATFGRMSPGRVFRMPETEVRDRLNALSSDPHGTVELMESLNQLIIRRRARPEPSRLLSAIYAPQRVMEKLHA